MINISIRFVSSLLFVFIFYCPQVFSGEILVRVNDESDREYSLSVNGTELTKNNENIAYTRDVVGGISIRVAAPDIAEKLIQFDLGENQQVKFY